MDKDDASRVASTRGAREKRMRGIVASREARSLGKMLKL